EGCSMKTFLSVKIALLPFVLYWLASGAGSPLLGALAGALIAALGLVYRTRSDGPRLLEGCALIVLSLIAALHELGFAGDASHGVAWSFLALGATCAVSVVSGRPWTAAYAAAAWPGTAQTPLFLRINSLLSSLWAVLFCYLGVAHWSGLAGAATWMPVALGVLASIGLPPLIVRFTLRRQLAGRETYRWAAPDL